MAHMTASKARTLIWLTIFEITIGIRPWPSEVRRGRGLRRGAADG